MKNFLLTILIIISLAGVCIISCPKHDEHSKALTQEINSAIDSKFSKEAESDNEIAVFASTLCSALSGFIIDKKLSVDNYFLFSVGKINLDGETKVISIGVLNHVFTDLAEYIKEELSK